MKTQTEHTHKENCIICNYEKLTNEDKKKIKDNEKKIGYHQHFKKIEMEILHKCFYCGTSHNQKEDCIK